MSAGGMLEVDWHRCQGLAMCAAALPGLVDADRWGYPRISRRGSAVSPERTADARWAARSCPLAALRFVPADQ